MSNSPPPPSIDRMCTNCGKGEESSGDLKACTACKLVKYCNRDCQIAHRPQHKKACKKRAAELHDEALFKEPPRDDECPICMLLLPLYDTHTGTTFRSCCGKIICDGCEYAMDESGAKGLCPFCKSPPSNSNEEEAKRVMKLTEKGNPSAYDNLAVHYAHGTMGLPQDRAKANELLLKAGDLGYAGAYYNLGQSYNEGTGVEIDKKKAKHYYELAAMSGNVHARNNIGCMEYNAGNYDRAFKHFIIAARAGHTNALNAVKGGYTEGHVTKEQYANTLREYQRSQDEMKSDARDKAAAMRNQ